MYKTLTKVIIAFLILTFLCACSTSNVSQTEQHPQSYENEIDISKTISLNNDTQIYSSPNEDSLIDGEVINNGESVDVISKIEDEDFDWYKIDDGKWIKVERVISFENMTHEELLDLLDGKFIGIRSEREYTDYGVYGKYNDYSTFSLEVRDNKLVFNEYNPTFDGYRASRAFLNDVRCAPINTDSNFYKDEYIGFYDDGIREGNNRMEHAVYFSKAGSLKDFQFGYIDALPRQDGTNSYYFSTYDNCTISNSLEESLHDGKIGEVIIKANKINIRMGCGVDYVEIGTVSQGEKYDVLGISINQYDDYTWYQIGINKYIADDGTWLTYTPKN